MTTILLHGLGQGPESWGAAAELEGEVLRPDLFGPVRGGEVSYSAVYRAFAGYCDALSRPLRLCGLSLGGVLALQYAIERPEKVEALALIGTPYAMPKGLLRLQDLVFRMMPERAFRSSGLAKAEVMGLTRSMRDLDFREDLEKVSCPALVLCGERDRANRKAAQSLREGLPQAELAWVPGAGHEVNLDAPEALAELLRRFFQKIG